MTAMEWPDESGPARFRHDDEAGSAYSPAMSASFDKVKKDAGALNTRERAKLARELIDGLDPVVDERVEALWIEEAERRYAAYRAGTMEAASGEEAMQRARKRLK